MAHVAGTDPYPWPYDGDLDPAPAWPWSSVGAQQLVDRRRTQRRRAHWAHFRRWPTRSGVPAAAWSSSAWRSGAPRPAAGPSCRSADLRSWAAGRVGRAAGRPRRRRRRDERLLRQRALDADCCGAGPSTADRSAAWARDHRRLDAAQPPTTAGYECLALTDGSAPLDPEVGTAPCPASPCPAGSSAPSAPRTDAAANALTEAPTDRRGDHHDLRSGRLRSLPLAVRRRHRSRSHRAGAASTGRSTSAAPAATSTRWATT